MSRTVLLIDDDLQFYSQLCQQLSSYDFEVHQADLAEESLAMARELAADLVIIAVDLPDKLGFALCHKAKKMLSAPVVLKTSTIPSDGFEKHRRLKSHADGYLDERILTEHELLSNVDSLIGLGDPIDGADDDGIEMDELEMDEIEMDDFGSESSEEMTSMQSEFLDESTKVAPSSPFLDPRLDAETDAAFAALGFDDDKPGRSFDTSDMNAADIALDIDGVAPFETQIEEVTVVGGVAAIDAAVLSGEMVDSHLESEELLAREQTTYVAPEEELSEDVPAQAAATTDDELELDDELESSSNGYDFAAPLAIADDHPVDPVDPTAEVTAYGQGGREPELGDAPIHPDALPQELDDATQAPEDEPLIEQASAASAQAEDEASDEPSEESDVEAGEESDVEASEEPEEEPVDESEEEPSEEALASSGDDDSGDESSDDDSGDEAGDDDSEEARDEDLAASSDEDDDDLDLGLEAIAQRAEEEHAASHGDGSQLSELAAENARLTEELAEAKSVASRGSSEFSREHEFLDLREKINKKEKALLDAQDRLTAKDRELLDSKDKLGQLERSKSELDEKNLQLEHEILRAKEKQSAQAEAIRAAELALKTANAAHEQALADAATAHSDTVAGLEARHQQEHSKAQSEHEAARAAALESAEEQHEAKLASLESAQQAALAQAAARLSEELEAAQQSAEQALQEQADTHSELLASKEAEHQSALEEAQAKLKQQKQELADQHAGKFSRLERENQEARQELEAAQEEALQQAEARHEAALEDAQEKAEAARVAAASASAAALEAAAEAHRDAMAAAAEGHATALSDALAAAEAQRTQELAVAAEELQALDDRRREELNAAAEEREASESQILAKANQDRAALEQEHEEVVVRLDKEVAQLKTALSTSRDVIVKVEQELAGARKQITEQGAALDSKDQIIALRDDRIAALKGEIAEIEEQNANYQEQVLKAYQKIKSDESTVGRAKKAMAIALTLLDETSDLAVDTDAPADENESVS